MVSDKNKRLYITLSRQTIEDLHYLSKFYDMTDSKVVQFLIKEKIKERNKM